MQLFILNDRFSTVSIELSYPKNYYPRKYILFLQMSSIPSFWAFATDPGCLTPPMEPPSIRLSQPFYVVYVYLVYILLILISTIRSV